MTIVFTAARRYSPDQKLRSHRRIVETASRLFRERGFTAVGVGAVMQVCDTAAGEFCAQFHSKEAFLGEALAFAMSDIRPRIAKGLTMHPRLRGFRRWCGVTLVRHIEVAPPIGVACPLSTEVGRSGIEVREVLQLEILEMGEFDGHLPDSGDEASRSRVPATRALCAGV